MAYRINYKNVLVFLFFASVCRAQGPGAFDSIYLVAPNWPTNAHYNVWAIPTSLSSNFGYSWPTSSGSGAGFLTNNGSGVLSWTAESSFGNGFIKNQTSLQTGANFNIDGNGNIGGTLDVAGSIQSNTLETSTSAGFALLGTTNAASGVIAIQSGGVGTIPISDGVTNVDWENLTAGKGITITNATGPPSITIATDFDSTFTAGAGIDFTGSTPGNLHINSHADSTGAKFILNGYSQQSSAGYNISAGAPAKTTSFAEATILNDATSSTASIIKQGLSISSTGSWAASGAGNQGIKLNVTGGANNYDIVGTTGAWFVDNNGDFTINQLTLNSQIYTNGSAGTSGQILTSQGASNPPTWAFSGGAARMGTQMSTPTAWSTAAMMGLGTTANITPATSGNVMFVISGTIANSVNNGGATVQLWEGTGTAPANGAAPAAGTAVGSAETEKVNVTGVGGTITLSTGPFNCVAYVTGLAAGTSVWFDISVTPSGAGNTPIASGIYVMAIEQ